MVNAIETKNLSKSYKNVEALKGVDLGVKEGEIFGFLGPNGAGKTTTIKIFLGFITSSVGNASILGLDSQKDSLEIKKRIGYLPETSSVYGRLSGRRHVEFAKETKKTDTDVDRVLERVGLKEAGDRRAGAYSKGMKQRLGLAIALVGEPDLFVLDEPTTGLDPNGARMVRDIVKEENDRGATVFFSSHILEQVEKVSDRVGILKNGELLVEDTIDNLRDQLTDKSILNLELDKKPNLDALKKIKGISDVNVTDKKITMKANDSVVKSKIFDAVEKEGAQIIDIKTEKTSLDDLFAILTEEEK